MATNDSQALSIVQNISEPSSIAMACVSGVFFICMLIKICTSKNHKGILFSLLVFLACRTATYALRAHLANSEKQGETIDGNEEIAAGVLLVSSYLFFIDAVLDLTSYWYLDLRDIHLTYNKVLILNLSTFGILTVISAVGTLGQVKLIDSFDPDEIQLGQRLLGSSGILFMVVAGFMMIFTILIAIIGPAPMRSKFTVEGSRCKPGVKPRMFISTIFLLFLQAALMVEAFFRVWSASDSNGFIRQNAAIALMVFLPETLGMVLAIFVNFQEPVRPTLISCQKRKYSNVDVSAFGKASYTGKEY